MAILEVSNLKKIYTTRFGGNQVQALRKPSGGIWTIRTGGKRLFPANIRITMKKCIKTANRKDMNL